MICTETKLFLYTPSYIIHLILFIVSMCLSSLAAAGGFWVTAQRFTHLRNISQTSINNCRVHDHQKQQLHYNSLQGGVSTWPEEDQSVKVYPSSETTLETSRNKWKLLHHHEMKDYQPGKIPVPHSTQSSWPHGQKGGRFYVLQMTPMFGYSDQRYRGRLQQLLNVVVASPQNLIILQNNIKPSARQAS